MVTTRSSGYAKLNGNSNGVVAKKQTKKRASEDTTEAVTKRPRLDEKTDLTRWRMLDEEGRHTWKYLEDDEAVKEWPQSYADKWYLGLDTVRSILLILLFHYIMIRVNCWGVQE